VHCVTINQDLHPAILPPNLLAVVLCYRFVFSVGNRNHAQRIDALLDYQVAHDNVGTLAAELVVKLSGGLSIVVVIFQERGATDLRKDRSVEPRTQRPLSTQHDISGFGAGATKMGYPRYCLGRDSRRGTYYGRN
jgi:hypothetical protein